MTKEVKMFRAVFFSIFVFSALAAHASAPHQVAPDEPPRARRNLFHVNREGITPFPQIIYWRSSTGETVYEGEDMPSFPYEILELVNDPLDVRTPQPMIQSSPSLLSATSVATTPTVDSGRLTRQVTKRTLAMTESEKADPETTTKKARSKRP